MKRREERNQLCLWLLRRKEHLRKVRNELKVSCAEAALVQALAEALSCEEFLLPAVQHVQGRLNDDAGFSFCWLQIVNEQAELPLKGSAIRWITASLFCCQAPA